MSTELSYTIKVETNIINYVEHKGLCIVDYQLVIKNPNNGKIIQTYMCYDVLELDELGLSEKDINEN